PAVFLCASVSTALASTDISLLSLHDALPIYCSNENAYGDQCEKCGSTLSPSELINPKSMLSGNIPVLKETKNWYLPLNEYETFLDRKSTRLNSSHVSMSYAVFCLKQNTTIIL